MSTSRKNQFARNNTFSSPETGRKAVSSRIISKGGGHLDAPSFVSPGSNQTNMARPTWKSSYLDKPSGAPRGSVMPARPRNAPFSPQHYGGSYLDKQNLIPEPSPKLAKMSYIAPFEEKPDIKITVNPDIQKKIQARQAAAKSKSKEDNVPEHIRRFREREERARKKLEEKEFRTKQIVEACFYAWKARAQYPRLRKENAQRIKKLARERAMKKLRLESAIKIQKTVRMYIPRKRYVRVITIKRRRERNEREIRRIEKQLERLPKETKAQLKKMKQDFSEQKKALKQKMRSSVKKVEKKEDKNFKKAEDQQRVVIEYLQAENKKLREMSERNKAEHVILQKQFDVLAQKSEEVSRNFKSLQQFVTKKNESIQKHEISSQKCRHSYLPKYRKDLVDRNKHCIAEFRVKKLYKAKLKKILKEIKEQSTDEKVYKEARNAYKAVEQELAAMPEVPVPSDLFEIR